MNQATSRRLTEIDEALARPAEDGPDWDRRRAQLEREREQLIGRPWSCAPYVVDCNAVNRITKAQG